MHPLYGALPLPYIPVRVKRSALVPDHYAYAPPRSTTGLLLSFQCICGTILLTLYSMMWESLVSNGGSMPFY